jgi:hypothetical protein
MAPFEAEIKIESSTERSNKYIGPGSRKLARKNNGIIFLAQL